MIAMREDREQNHQREMAFRRALETLHDKITTPKWEQPSFQLDTSQRPSPIQSPKKAQSSVVTPKAARAASSSDDKGSASILNDIFKSDGKKVKSGGKGPPGDDDPEDKDKDKKGKKDKKDKKDKDDKKDRKDKKKTKNDKDPPDDDPDDDDSFDDDDDEFDDDEYDEEDDEEKELEEAKKTAEEIVKPMGDKPKVKEADTIKLLFVARACPVPSMEIFC
jgi:hypothetical protein